MAPDYSNLRIGLHPTKDNVKSHSISQLTPLSPDMVNVLNHKSKEE